LAHSCVLRFFFEYYFVDDYFPGRNSAALLNKKRGEKRTGPALNPLKGSSVRLPHCLYYCISAAKLKLFIFSQLSPHCRVKKLHTREILPVRRILHAPSIGSGALATFQPHFGLISVDKQLTGGYNSSWVILRLVPRSVGIPAGVFAFWSLLSV
jgi:hypothetical protein